MTNASATAEAITVPGSIDEPVVVTLNGSYLWSFTPARDGDLVDGQWQVRWPQALAPFLHGRGRVRLSDVSGSTVWLDKTVRLTWRGRFAVADEDGQPLSVDKVGHLSRSFSATDNAVKTEVLRVTKKVLKDLTKHAGVEAYLCYGALLGAIRDGGMLAYDSDTDVCFLSAYTHPADIIRESYRVERLMRARGWETARMSGADFKVLHTGADGRVVQIDVFGAFYVSDTFFQLGNRNGHLDRSVISPVKKMQIAGVKMPVPHQPEAMLTFLYGENWRTPDPSFKYDDNPVGVRRLDGWLRGYRDDISAWSEFYDHGAWKVVPTEPSSFFHWVAETLPANAPVADIGAGTGRDTFGFLDRGDRVIALEARCGAAAVIRQEAERRGVADRLEGAGFLRPGEFRTVAAVGARLARQPRHLYVRDVLGCLTPDARLDLWRLGRFALRGRGHRTFVEFPAVADGAPAMPGPGRRDRLDPAVIRAEVEAVGGRIDREYLGEGEDFFGGVDPAVCRFEIAWT